MNNFDLPFVPQPDQELEEATKTRHKRNAHKYTYVQFANDIINIAESGVLFDEELSARIKAKAEDLLSSSLRKNRYNEMASKTRYSQSPPSPPISSSVIKSTTLAPPPLPSIPFVSSASNEGNESSEEDEKEVLKNTRISSKIPSNSLEELAVRVVPLLSDVPKTHAEICELLGETVNPLFLVNALRAEDGVIISKIGRNVTDKHGNTTTKYFNAYSLK